MIHIIYNILEIKEESLSGFLNTFLQQAQQLT